MLMTPSYFNHDPQRSGPQYIEDLATGYWFSKVLFTALESGVFDRLAGGSRSAAGLAGELGWEPNATTRFLRALVAMGLLLQSGDQFCNSGLAADCLVQGGSHYQGDSVLWRRQLAESWQGLAGCLRAGGRVSYPDDDRQLLQERVSSYIKAMDNVARSKAEEILPLFDVPGTPLAGGAVLDLGTGSGALATAFLERFPGSRATLVDLPQVLEVTRELLQSRCFGDRVCYAPNNILEEWSLPEDKYDLVILSNIVHAYSEAEIPGILARAAAHLSAGGYLLIHDFFPEHYPVKASLLDLNMLINTYNGRLYPLEWLREKLSRMGLTTSELLPLATDTALIIAAPNAELLGKLGLTDVGRLIAEVGGLGFTAVRSIPVETIKVVDWADLRCQFGCPHYGKKPHCPPHAPAPEKTRRVLQDFRTALLLEGEPPGGDFQRKVLEVERLAFTAGFYKAFSFWAGSCQLCAQCTDNGVCRQPEKGRPSMEGSGIDVFATVRQAGFGLRTLTDKNEHVKYYALLLLE
jgi:predicted metal-binding protein/ubiquinone/menaquinone biosynthesis C-methylase UbiE